MSTHSDAYYAEQRGINNPFWQKEGRYIVASLANDIYDAVGNEAGDFWSEYMVEFDVPECYWQKTLEYYDWIVSVKG
jgi:hypothetical protein